MCLGIAITWSEVPTEMIGACGLGKRLHHRAGVRPEFWFFFADRRPKIPVVRDGQLYFVRWGNGRGQSRVLPRSGHTWLEEVSRGKWKGSGAIPVTVPATYAKDGRGVWFPVHCGIRALLLPDEHGKAVAYLVCEPASHFYKVYTGSDRMPVFINQRL